jgi:hypothetical protein
MKPEFARRAEMVFFNQGSIADKSNRKVCVSYSLSISLPFPVGDRHSSTEIAADEQLESKSGRKAQRRRQPAATTENISPQMRLGAAPSPASISSVGSSSRVRIRGFGFAYFPETVES